MTQRIPAAAALVGPPLGARVETRHATRASRSAMSTVSAPRAATRSSSASCSKRTMSTHQSIGSPTPSSASVPSGSRVTATTPR